MKISTKQLRMQPGRIINMKEFDSEGELFGIWKNREDTKDVEQYIRNMRIGNRRCNNSGNSYRKSGNFDDGK